MIEQKVDPKKDEQIVAPLKENDNNDEMTKSKKKNNRTPLILISNEKLEEIDYLDLYRNENYEQLGVALVSEGKAHISKVDVCFQKLLGIIGNDHFFQFVIKICIALEDLIKQFVFEKQHVWLPEKICKVLISFTGHRKDFIKIDDESVLYNVIQELPENLHYVFVISLVVNPPQHWREELIQKALVNVNDNAKIALDGVKMIVHLNAQDQNCEAIIEKMWEYQNFVLTSSFVNDGSSEKLKLALLQQAENKCSECLAHGVKGYKLIRVYAKKIYTAGLEWKLMSKRFENLETLSHMGTLRFFVHSRQSAAVHDNWTDLIEVLVFQFPSLQIYLLRELANYKDYESFQFFVRILSVPFKIYNPIVNETRWNENPFIRRKRSIPKFPYAKLKVPYVLVNTPQLLAECEQCLQEFDGYIGLDVEWNVTVIGIEIPTCALIQFAVCDRVFLLDMLCFDKAVINASLIKLFGYETTKFIGFDTSNDMKRLIEICPELMGMKNKIVDLSVVQKKVYKITKAPEDEPKGLAHLCNRWLSLSLDKTFQISDWTKRPLRNAQLNYAALDAFLLIELKKLMDEFLISHDAQCNTQLGNVSLTKDENACTNVS